MKSISYFRYLGLIGFMAFIQACGQSGPLYLPDQPPPIKVVDIPCP